MFLLVSGTIAGMTEQNRKHLAEAVIARRVELGMLKTTALAGAAELSPRMLGDVENGRRENFSPGAKAQIERALQWQMGSIDRVLAGGDPTPLTPGTTTQKPIRTAQTRSRFRDPEGALVDILAAAGGMADMLEESHGLGKLPDEVREKMDLAQAKTLSAATKMLVLACEFIGEAVAGEDANDIGELADSLAGRVRQLESLRSITARIHAALTPAPALRGTLDGACGSDDDFEFQEDEP